MNYYDEILKLSEAKDFSKVIKKWNKLSDNLSTTKNVPLVLPDLLWVSKSGVGKTHLLNLLSEYLLEKGNLIEFYGNVKYFEFMLDYCAPNNRFFEIQRMINEIKNAAGFRDRYKGIISIDIDEWVDHCEEKHFISFLEFLSSNSDDWLIVFNISTGNEEDVKKLESILLMYFRIEKSILSLPESNEFLEFIIQRLSGYDVVLDKSAQDLLLKSIEKLRENKYFDGYKTLIMLCQDIIYELYSSNCKLGSKITDKDLVEFNQDSKYITRATWKAEKKSKIGLIN